MIMKAFLTIIGVSYYGVYAVEKTTRLSEVHQQLQIHYHFLCLHMHIQLVYVGICRH